MNYRPGCDNESANSTDILAATQEAIQQTTSYLKANTNDISEHMTMDIPSHCLLSLVDDPRISTLGSESILDSSSAALDLVVIPYISRCLLKIQIYLKIVLSYIHINTNLSLIFNYIQLYLLFF